MIYLAVAMILIWLAVFIFVFSMVRRQQALEQEVAALREALNGSKPAERR